MQQRETRYVRWLVAFALLSVGIGWLGWHFGAPDDERMTVTVTQAPPAPEPPRPIEEPPAPRTPPHPKPQKPHPPVVQAPVPPPMVAAAPMPPPEPPPEQPTHEPYSFQGIGAVLRQTEAGIVIAAVLPGSPAGNAGLRAADTIQAIDGVAATAMTVPQVTQRIRGEIGTAVTLDIDRPGEGRQTLRIERGRITIDHAMAAPQGMPMPAPAMQAQQPGEMPVPPPNVNIAP